jgi:hypothetical protein
MTIPILLKPGKMRTGDVEENVEGMVLEQMMNQVMKMNPITKNID